MTTIHLQGAGSYTAKPAASLQAGDLIVWNFGSTSRVLSVAPGAKTVVVKLSGGYTRRFNSSRLVAVQ